MGETHQVRFEEFIEAPNQKKTPRVAAGRQNGRQT
jgi:hypothetical protein